MGHISPTNKGFVIAYVLLVALPLLGLVGVLRSGRALVAPTSVDGVWKFTADGANPSADRCGKSLASLQDSLVTISQSGKRLGLSLNDLSLNDSPPLAGSGAIEGATLNATIPLPEAAAKTSANEPGCGNNIVLALTATVIRKPGSRSMQGTVSVSECPSCASLKFQAVWQSRSGNDAH
jgi:hypothetical protein